MAQPVQQVFRVPKVSKVLWALQVLKVIMAQPVQQVFRVPKVSKVLWALQVHKVLKDLKVLKA
jgi:hypothetical protein